MVKRIIDQKYQNGKEVYDAIIKYLEDNSFDFKAEKTRFDEAASKFTFEFSEAQQLFTAHEEENAYNAWFTFNLGKSACRNAEQFLEKDPEIYLQESNMNREPENLKIYRKIRTFESKMSYSSRELYLDSILEYYALLETYIPKLAHYYGYMCEVKQQKATNPEFQEDASLIAAYTERLSDYLSVDLKEAI